MNFLDGLSVWTNEWVIIEWKGDILKNVYTSDIHLTVISLFCSIHLFNIFY